MTDTGCSLNAQQMTHLFEPFNRLGAEAEGIEGTGIGLAIVKSLVERMGGTVRVDSTPGQGSCFQVRLQAAGAAAQHLRRAGRNHPPCRMCHAGPVHRAKPPRPGPTTAPTGCSTSRTTRSARSS